MHKILLILLFSVNTLIGSAQKVYFVYLQTEPAQPFFVKMDEKIHSSSATGYLILSKLYDTTYLVTIGFPMEKWPEQKFSLSVGGKDHGFVMKQFGETGWGLFDLQTLAIQMPAAVITKTIPATKEFSNENDFTSLLAKAADDPSLLEKPKRKKVENSIAVVEKKEPDNKETIVPARQEPVITKTETGTQIPAEAVEKKQDSVISQPEPILDPYVVSLRAKVVETKPVVAETKSETIESKPEVIEKKPEIIESKVELNPITAEKDNEKAVNVVKTPEPDRNEPVFTRSVVRKKSESSTTEGFGLVYLDEFNNGNTDTIRLLIPFPKTIAGTNVEEKKEEKTFLAIAETTPVEVKANETTSPKVEVEKTIADSIISTPSAIESCDKIAAEEDFFNLRKEMAASIGDEEMIMTAKKYFKLKCYTVQQIKNISPLFLNDEGKYNFFDAAYKYIADKSLFAQLEEELKDEYYIKRFRAIIR